MSLLVNQFYSIRNQNKQPERDHYTLNFDDKSYLNFTFPNPGPNVSLSKSHQIQAYLDQKKKKNIGTL